MQTPTVRRVTDGLILLGVAGLGLAVGGALDGWLRDPAKADWVEAWGTWAGVCATLVSVLVAVRALTADREAEREARRTEEERSAQAARVQASLVLVQAEVTGGTRYAGRETVNKVTYSVQNLSSRPVLDLFVFHPQYCPATVRVAHQLEPGRTAKKDIPIDPGFTVADDQKSATTKLLAGVRISYLIDGERWFRGPDPARLPAQELPTGWGAS